MNIGVTRETSRSWFAPEPGWGPGGGVVQTGHDFPQIDTLLPNPIDAPMSWLCMVSPSERNGSPVRVFLHEADAATKGRYDRTRGKP